MLFGDSNYWGKEKEIMARKVQSARDIMDYLSMEGWPLFEKELKMEKAVNGGYNVIIL